MVDTSVFECGLCACPYDESAHKPLSMPCGHVFCSACVVKQCKGTLLLCPVDSSKHAVSPYALPCCFAILANLPKPSGQGHLLCPRHCKKRLKFICTPHNKLLCSECIIEHTGQGHAVSPFTGNLVEIKEDLRGVSESCASKLHEVQFALNSLESNERAASGFYEGQLNRLNTAYEGAFRTLKQKKKESMCFLRKHMAEQSKGIEKLKSRLLRSFEAQKKLTSQVTALDRLLENKEYEQFFSLIKQAKQDAKTADASGERVELELWGYKDVLHFTVGSPMRFSEEEDSLKENVKPKDKQKTCHHTRPKQLEDSPRGSATNRGDKPQEKSPRPPINRPRNFPRRVPMRKRNNSV